MVFSRVFIVLCLFNAVVSPAFAESPSFSRPENQTKSVTSRQIIEENTKLETYKVARNNLDKEINILVSVRRENPAASDWQTFLMKYPNLTSQLAMGAAVSGSGILIYNQSHAWRRVAEAVNAAPTDRALIHKLRMKAFEVESRGRTLLVAAAVLTIWTLGTDSLDLDSNAESEYYYRALALKHDPASLDAMIANRLEERVQLELLVAQQEYLIEQLQIKSAGGAK